jgi:hypothetical protein
VLKKVAKIVVQYIFIFSVLESRQWDKSYISGSQGGDCEDDNVLG